MTLLPFALLAASLAAFLLSTRQMGFVWRSAVWLGGIGLLAASAIVILLGPTSPGVLQALFDLVLRQHGGEVLRTALDGNFATVGAAIAPMFGVFFVLSLIVGVVSLIAFTPGEAIEKAIRPLNTLLIGAIGGGLLAIAVSGVGFGGLEKRRVFINVVALDDVIDGDTIRMGDVSVRLWGIDTPENRTDQMCRRRDSVRTPYKCGEEAKSVLTALAANKLVICQKPGLPDSTAKPGVGQKPPKESFGRPVMSCWTAATGDRLYLSAEMGRQGYADAYLDNQQDPSREEILGGIAEAKSKPVGIWQGWTISPDDWRNNPQCRLWFMQRDWQPPAGSNSTVTVTCPDFNPPPPANDNASAVQGTAPLSTP